MRFIGIVLSICVAVGTAGCGSSSRPFGEFRGSIQTQWLNDGRSMELLADFAYIDPGGTEWRAGRGAHVDGASIPQVFWTLIGGPFEGQYRDASIVHDVACQVKDRAWRDVHLMFYNASRCGGVNELKAKLMYAAVYHFGPRWGDDTEDDTRLDSDEDFERMQLVIATDPNVGTTEIQRLTPTVLRARVPHLPTRGRSEMLTVPRFRKAVTAAGGRDVRLSSDQSKVEFMVGDEEAGLRVKRALNQVRTMAAADVDEDVKKLHAQIAGENDRDRRAVLATQLVTLSRERAALSRVNIGIKVAPPPDR